MVHGRDRSNLIYIDMIQNGPSRNIKSLFVPFHWTAIILTSDKKWKIELISHLELSGKPITSCDFIFKLLQLGISEEDYPLMNRDGKVNTWGRCWKKKNIETSKIEGILRAVSRQGTHTP